MKPTTDDIVLSLFESARKRQGRVLAPSVNDAGPARIIDFARAVDALPAAREDRVVSLKAPRRAGQVRRTIHGIFCYAPNS